MNVTRYSPVGTDLKSLILGVQQIRGVIIDNPSGSWLYLPEITGFCPPYTKAWSIDINPTVASLSVLFRAGPAGQVSTRQGDPIQVTIFDTPVGNSAGIASGGGFIESFTPVLSTETTIDAHTNASVLTSHLPIVANKRYRILTAVAVYDALGDTSNTGDSPVTITLEANPAGTPTISLYLSGRFHAVDSRIYPAGLDYPVGVGVQSIAIADWADVSINVEMSYQLI